MDFARCPHTLVREPCERHEVWRERMRAQSKPPPQRKRKFLRALDDRLPRIPTNRPQARERQVRATGFRKDFQPAHFLWKDRDGGYPSREHRRKWRRAISPYRVPSQPSLASFRENHFLQEVRVTLLQKFAMRVNRSTTIPS